MKFSDLPLDTIQKIFLCDCPELQGLYLFGSFAAGHADAKSDLDFAVLSPEPVGAVMSFNLAQEIAQIVHRDVDVIDLRNASTVMQFQIVSKGIRFFTQDELNCASFEDFVYKSYARLNEERIEILKDIKKRGAVSL